MKKLTILTLLTSLFLFTVPTSASASGWPKWIGFTDWIFGNNDIDISNDADITKDLNILEDDFDIDLDLPSTIHTPTSVPSETYDPAYGVQDFWDLYFETMYGTDSSGVSSNSTKTLQPSTSSFLPVSDDENWPDWIDEPGM